MQHQIGPINVKAKVNYLGPIVWTDAWKDKHGDRHTDFAATSVAALPPELSPEQQAALALNILGRELPIALSEVERRVGGVVSEYDFMFSPEWQCKVNRILIIKPMDELPRVFFNEEVDRQEVPSDCCHALLIREGPRWDIRANDLPQFPTRPQDQVWESVMHLAEAILKGDDESASDMAKLWFPGIWEDNPESIRRLFHKEIYVLLFHLWGGRALIGSPSTHPLQVIQQSFPTAVEGLKGDYTWESLRAEGQYLSRFAGTRLEQFLTDTETWFLLANLSDQELRIVKLETALSVRSEKWSADDKMKFLNMKRGTYGAALNRAKKKLMRRNTRQDSYKKLLEAMFNEQEG